MKSEIWFQFPEVLLWVWFKSYAQIQLVYDSGEVFADP